MPAESSTERLPEAPAAAAETPDALSSGVAAASQADGPAYGVEWLAHNLPDRWPQGGVYHVHARARNAGTRTWLAAEPRGRCVDLVVRVNGGIQQMVRVPHDVPPGGEVAFAFGFNFPVNLLRGHDNIQLSLGFVEQDVAWFEQHGGDLLTVAVAVGPMEATATADLMLLARAGGTAYYQPSGGVTRGRDGRPYPLLVRDAVGCRVRDPDGNEWVDYVMGWGAAFVGTDTRRSATRSRRPSPAAGRSSASRTWPSWRSLGCWAT